MSEIKSKLEKSDANHSLQSEWNVKSILNDLNWWAVQGPFYEDPKTTKLREIDTVAYKAWAKKGADQEYYLIRLHLLIEVKSAKNYHLLFSPIENIELGNLCNSNWSGSYEDRKNKIAQTLLDGGMPKEKISLVLKNFYKMHYPWEDYLSGMFVEPPKADNISTTFRETNIGNVKEIETSVLWKASQTLHSTVKSWKEKLYEEYLYDLKFLSEINLKYEDQGIEHALDEIYDKIQSEKKIIDIYHPVVVIDSRLWNSQQDGLFEIEWCRFVQVSVDRYSNWWFDVINSNQIQSYLSQITSYYQYKIEENNFKQRVGTQITKVK